MKLVYPNKPATLSSQTQQSNIMHTSTSMATNTGANPVNAQQSQTIVIKNQVNIVEIVFFSIQSGTTKCHIYFCDIVFV